MAFDPRNFGPSVTRLLSAPRLPELGPGRADPAVLADLRAISVETLAAGHPIRDRTMLECCRSALWLHFDYLDESHQISQTIETPSGSYWHGIMHRREGDFGNAKYWFRRVGRHPLFAELGPAAQVAAAEPGGRLPPAARWLAKGEWDPFQFVDLCQSTQAGGGIDAQLCQNIALVEWQVLFDYCYQQGVDTPSSRRP